MWNMGCDPAINTSWKPIHRLGGSQTYTLRMSRADSDSDSDSDRGLFNIKLHTKVLHQVYIAKQYEHFEQIWTWHNQKYLLGDLY